MKTKQELLDFYGVEIGKKYKVTKSENFVEVGTIFTINNECEIFPDIPFPLPLFVLDYLDYEEIKQPILNDVEREYLQKYVMDNPAFKGKVDEIVKLGEYDKTLGFLVIRLKDVNDRAYLPCFKLDTMYKNMKLNKAYTPQELGLEE